MELQVHTFGGRRPIPKCAATPKSTPQEVRKVALGSSAADARRHTFASLRSPGPAARASIYLFILSRAAAHDAGSSGGAAASQCCSSLKQHLFVAARRRSRRLHFSRTMGRPEVSPRIVPSSCGRRARQSGARRRSKKGRTQNEEAWSEVIITRGGMSAECRFGNRLIVGLSSLPLSLWW